MWLLLSHSRECMFFFSLKAFECVCVVLDALIEVCWWICVYFCPCADAAQVVMTIQMCLVASLCFASIVVGVYVLALLRCMRLTHTAVECYSMWHSWYCCVFVVLMKERKECPVVVYEWASLNCLEYHCCCFFFWSRADISVRKRLLKWNRKKKSLEIVVCFENECMILFKFCFLVKFW